MKTYRSLRLDEVEEEDAASAAEILPDERIKAQEPVVLALLLEDVLDPHVAVEMNAGPGLSVTVSE